MRHNLRMFWVPAAVIASVFLVHVALGGGWSARGWAQGGGGGNKFELAPMDLVVHEQDQVAGMTGDAGASAIRTLGPLPQFQPSTMLSLNEQFTDPTLGRFTTLSESGGPVTPTIASGQITFANPASTSPTPNTLMYESSGLSGNGLLVPQYAVKMHIVSVTTDATNTYENMGVGIVQDTNNYMNVTWAHRDSPQHLQIQVKIGGVSNFRGAISMPVTTPPFDIGLSLVSNQLEAWLSTDGGNTWIPETSWLLTEIDMRSATLANWHPYFGIADSGNVTFTCVYSSFKFGSFGGTGIRDISPVTNLDGTIPLTGANNSLVTFSASMTDPQGAAYNGIFTYDLLARTLTQTGVNFVNRSSKLFNDGAQHLVKDGSGGYHNFITTWGNAGTGASNINILYKHETVINLTSGITIEASMTQPTIPNIPSGGGDYDPHVVCPPLLSPNCYLAYTVGPTAANSFYPALATASSIGAASWSAVGQDGTAVPYEGTRIWPIAGSYWVMAASNTDTNVYDLTMTYQGKFASFQDTAANQYPPHPTLIPLNQYQYYLTFDNTQLNSVAGTQGNYRTFRALRYAVQ